jgi:hypothetical protein
MRKYTCPCCGFVTFEEPSGSHDICNVCGWQDDNFQLGTPFSNLGANHKSLWVSQTEFLKSVPQSTETYKGFKRDPEWRAMDYREARAAQEVVITGLDYFRETCESNYDYYWKINGKK